MPKLAVKIRDRIPPSLMQRAVAALARREHSRTELARKLRRYLADGADRPEIDRVLDELSRKGLLSDARFATGLVRTRAGRFGVARIRQELKQHGLDPELVARSTAGLRESELARAREIWLKRFGGPPKDDGERARQVRFLTTRGFAPDVVLRVVRGDVADD